MPSLRLWGALHLESLLVQVLTASLGHPGPGESPHLEWLCEHVPAA